MRKLGWFIGMVAAVALLLSLERHAHASTKDEKAIKDVESQDDRHHNTDDLMSITIRTTSTFTILPAVGSTKATPPFVATLTTYSPILPAPKQFRRVWFVVPTARWGWPAAIQHFACDR